MNYFVTGIGTDIGKTLISAIMVEALGADYWKPIQSGLPRDTETVQKLVDNPEAVFHPEAFVLNTPASPHAAAEIDGVALTIDGVTMPNTTNTLVIEGAGGTMVPLSHKEFIIDMVPKLQAEVVLVANFYLGSINHTLLTFELLKQRGYPVKGIIFNGDVNPQSEEVIMEQAWFPCLMHVGQEENLNKSVVKNYAEQLRSVWK